MINYHLATNMDGDIAITSNYHNEKSLQTISTFYKFIWVREGNVIVEIDHIPMTLHKDEIISITPLHHFNIKECNGEYIALMFNSNFYCIFGHDKEVSCNGFLFNGSSNIFKIELNNEEIMLLDDTISLLLKESESVDTLQEEMLRILLKRFIILCTRFAREHYGFKRDKDSDFNLVRQFYILVDQHFKEKHQVKDYANILLRSPKTISNLLASCALPSPLSIIHNRIISEAKRLLLYTNKSAKEIALILGFDDAASFSRFFKKITGSTISNYKNMIKKE